MKRMMKNSAGRRGDDSDAVWNGTRWLGISVALYLRVCRGILPGLAMVEGLERLGARQRQRFRPTLVCTPLVPLVVKAE